MSLSEQKESNCLRIASSLVSLKVTLTTSDIVVPYRMGDKAQRTISNPEKNVGRAV
jgi:hypothetical protein